MCGQCNRTSTIKFVSKYSYKGFFTKGLMWKKLSCLQKIQTQPQSQATIAFPIILSSNIIVMTTFMLQYTLSIQLAMCLQIQPPWLKAQRRNGWIHGFNSIFKTEKTWSRTRNHHQWQILHRLILTGNGNLAATNHGNFIFGVRP